MIGGHIHTVAFSFYTHAHPLAGRDTTAATLTFVVYLLSQHPDVLQRLRAEILEKVGPSRRPDFEDLKDLKYLRAVLNGVSAIGIKDPF